MKIYIMALAIAMTLTPSSLLAAKLSASDILFRGQEIMDKYIGASIESGRRNEAERHWASQHEWYSPSDSDRRDRSHWRSLHEWSGEPQGQRESGASRRSWISSE